MVGGGGEEAVEGFEDEDEDSLDEDILIDLPICVQVQINTLEIDFLGIYLGNRDIYFLEKSCFPPTSFLKFFYFTQVSGEIKKYEFLGKSIIRVEMLAS